MCEPLCMRLLAALAAAVAVLAAATDSAAVDAVHFGISPAWSPNGKAIAFVVGAEGALPDLWVMNADGSGARRLTSGRYADSPTWSPDSKRIAFSYASTFEMGVSVINADGSGLHEIVHNGSGPAWSPGGRRIAFSVFPGEDRPRWIYV